MSLKHGLLGLLNYEPRTGYELAKDFKESLAYFWTAKASQIYRELDAMEKSGWLASERVIQEDKPNKRVYSITNAGKEELLNWLSSYDPFSTPQSHKSAFMMRMFFGGELDKEETIAMLRKAREKAVAQIQEMKGILEWLDTGEDVLDDPKRAVYWKLTAMSGEIFGKSTLEWIDKSIDLLEQIEE